MNLTNKTIFITGGASGIGRECVTAYLRAGARVSVLDRDENALNELQMQFGNEALLTWQGDVRQKEDIQNAIEQTVAAFGSLHVIHNNAGIASPSKPVHETSEDEWDSLFEINLKSVYYTTKYGLEHLKQTRGNILNTSSIVGTIGQENHAAYVATKGGMSALTKAMALDYAPFGIRVNAVCPAGVWTPMLRTWAGEQPNTNEIEQYLDDIHPLGDCPEGDVIADVAVFLVSDAARFVTGCIMPVSGGAELGYRR
ncbi:SDR family NAD(P)-dependent oxidoreductase [Dyadobacter jiangsuensis]|uniref:NAD(P)-dependent dehydrogenase (Short-subunit alcohol dehydrogenase family) n=1 Tax=Dyadobacter jiangsuensis TaxID=1591085 RepID=A0A2P8GJP6_9BACT|nr:SDR family oxidoreductase [Dyadobacter jiangsuensis]PSL34181.1 NAD(P)-dependent dehydrogenase (short-subunit alcohol dehydrogenase family) [Dyadobacter jiangsuensis]